ncbi:hypothetical protein Plhal304r1_c004g0016381 [Plasmopara halstedii]
MTVSSILQKYIHRSNKFEVQFRQDCSGAVAAYYLAQFFVLVPFQEQAGLPIAIRFPLVSDIYWSV